MNFAKKSLGQNFLIDKNIINKIIDLTTIGSRDIIEIGPGEGALTEEILKRKPRSITVIEKDNKLAEKLKIKYHKNNLVKIYNADILKFNIEKIISRRSAIFGNLPYNISSQILVSILRVKKWPPKFNDLIFMFQKELGAKIVGTFPSKNYGRLSILSNYRLNIMGKFFVSPNCFTPKPKIISMVIHFQPKNTETFNIKKINNLEKITNIFFSNKRKMIKKKIQRLLKKNQIDQIPEIDLNLRPSNISPDIYYKITELFERQ